MANDLVLGFKAFVLVHCDNFVFFGLAAINLIRQVSYLFPLSGNLFLKLFHLQAVVIDCFIRLSPQVAVQLGLHFLDSGRRMVQLFGKGLDLVAQELIFAHQGSFLELMLLAGLQFRRLALAPETESILFLVLPLFVPPQQLILVLQEPDAVLELCVGVMRVSGVSLARRVAPVESLYAGGPLQGLLVDLESLDQLEQFFILLVHFLHDSVGFPEVLLQLRRHLEQTGVLLPQLVQLHLHCFLLHRLPHEFLLILYHPDGGLCKRPLEADNGLGVLVGDGPAPLLALDLLSKHLDDFAHFFHINLGFVEQPAAVLDLYLGVRLAFVERGPGVGLEVVPLGSEAMVFVPEPVDLHLELLAEYFALSVFLLVVLHFLEGAFEHVAQPRDLIFILIGAHNLNIVSSPNTNPWDSLLLHIKEQHNMDPEKPPHKGKFETLQETIAPETREKWTQEQDKIRQKIVEADAHDWNIDTIKLICGVDLSANKNDPDIACAGLVVYNIREHSVVYEDYEIIRISQPYIPGFLAFREVPPLYEMFMRLKQKCPEAWPELIMLDGNGILHSNKCGLASHLGVLLDTPSLGVGKTLFYIDGLGKEEVKKLCAEQITKQNEFALLRGESGKVWGAGLRNGKNATNPVYVSVGTKIELQTAIKCVILASDYRVPEPIRLADKKSRELIEAVDLSKDHSHLKRYDMIYLP